MSANGSLLIGELARAAGVNIQTIRYYERRRLLRPPAREMNRYRRYEPEAVRVVARRSCGDVRDRAAAKLADIEQKIERLRAMRKTLVRFIAACSGRGPVSACPILEALDEEEPKTVPKSRGRR